MTTPIASLLSFSLDNALEKAVGPDHGLTDEDWTRLEGKIASGHAALMEARKAGQYGFADLPHVREGLDAIQAQARIAADRFADFVILGIGGSALGTRAVLSALGPTYPVPGSVRPRVHVVDNIDPGCLAELLQNFDPATTGFNVITKSGGTPETATQFLLVKDYLERSRPGKVAEHLWITTDPERGDLRAIVEKESLPSFPVPKEVGGRYSVLSPVGLFPCAVAGVDVSGLLAGAARFDRYWQEADPLANPAYLFAGASHLLHTRRQKSIVVLFAYSQKLFDTADWFRQLWAESLGKRASLQGEEVYAGSTPIRALGTTDQHSQLQLYTEGPNDKFLVFVEPRESAGDPAIPALYPESKSLAYLGGHRVSELFRAERIGTEVALREAQRPTGRLVLERVDAEGLGFLFQALEVATVFAGRLYDVNPFDQPGVERGKVVAAALLGKAGLDDVRGQLREAGVEGISPEGGK